MVRALAAGTGLLFAIVGTATGAGAQGLISMQKLSAPLANELVGESVAHCAQNAVGAIGVSGAPGGQFDEECARAAIAKIQDRMK